MEAIRVDEQTPLSLDDLRVMLGPDESRCKLLMYDELVNFTTLADLIPNRLDAAIILLQIQSPNAPAVGHWIALMNHGDHYEHFDSYGLDPDEELGITHEKPILTELIANSTMRVESNQAKLQSRKEHMNTCGRWCIVRVRFPQLEKPQFVDFIRQVHHVPDVAVTLLTHLLS